MEKKRSTIILKNQILEIIKKDFCPDSNIITLYDKEDNWLFKLDLNKNNLWIGSYKILFFIMEVGVFKFKLLFENQLKIKGIKKMNICPI